MPGAYVWKLFASVRLHIALPIYIYTHILCVVIMCTERAGAHMRLLCATIYVQSFSVLEVFNEHRPHTRRQPPRQTHTCSRALTHGARNVFCVNWHRHKNTLTAGGVYQNIMVHHTVRGAVPESDLSFVGVFLIAPTRARNQRGAIHGDCCTFCGRPT